MKKIKKYLRIIALVLFITFAAAAGGLFGVPLTKLRQNDTENPKIEMIDKEEEEEDDEETGVQEKN
jgi:hypothetical protein